MTRVVTKEKISAAVEILGRCSKPHSALNGTISLRLLVIGFPLVGAHANFLKPARFGASMYIDSLVVEFRRSSFDIEHRVFVGDDLAVEGGESRVWAARDKNNTISAVAIPAKIKSQFT